MVTFVVVYREKQRESRVQLFMLIFSYEAINNLNFVHDIPFKQPCGHTLITFSGDLQFLRLLQSSTGSRVTAV